MPTLGFHQPHWETQDSITAAEHVSPRWPTQGDSPYRERCYRRRPELGEGKEGKLCFLPSATVTSPKPRREEKDERTETSWRLSPNRARLPLLFSGSLPWSLSPSVSLVCSLACARSLSVSLSHPPSPLSPPLAPFSSLPPPPPFHFPSPFAGFGFTTAWCWARGCAGAQNTALQGLHLWLF